MSATDVVDVLIVGAGIAGLAAAKTLQQRRPDLAVVVVEARDRVGGRLHTVQVDGCALDLGATFVHGTGGNPVAELLAGAGVPLRAWDTGCTVVLGERADDVQRHCDADAVWQHLAAAGQRWLASKDNTEADISLGQLRDDYVLPQFANEPAALFAVRWHCNAVLESDWAADPFDMSTRAWLDCQGDEEQGGDHLVVGGYAELVRLLLADSAPVHTNSRVTSIVEEASVYLAHVDHHQQQVIRARTVLVTVPASVLRAGGIDFAPPLPDDVHAALQLLGAANLVWASLLFDERWWPEAAFGRGDGVVWNAQPATAFRWPFFFVRPASHLVTFASGADSHRLDDASDEQITDELLAVLAALAGCAVPRPRRLLRTRWRCDPFAAGAYSYRRVGFTQRHADALLQCVGRGLFFAGEHTDGDAPATVRGAYCSGVRAARQIEEWAFYSKVS